MWCCKLRELNEDDLCKECAFEDLVEVVKKKRDQRNAHNGVTKKFMGRFVNNLPATTEQEIKEKSVWGLVYKLTGDIINYNGSKCLYRHKQTAINNFHKLNKEFFWSLELKKIS